MEQRDYTYKIEVERLSAYARAHFPWLPTQDLVQDAFMHAQVHNSELEGQARYLALQKALMSLARSDRYRRATTVLGAADESSDWTLPQVHPRSRPPRVPHTPKGLVPVVKPGSHIEHIPICEGDLPTPLQIAMAQRIRDEVIEPLLRGGTASSNCLDALAGSYKAFFGVGPKHAWAQVLVEEIAEAKKAKLAHLSMIAAQARPALVQSDNTWAVTIQATEAGRSAYPQFSKEREIPVRPVLVNRTEHDAVLALVGELEEGKPELIGYLPGSFSDWLPPDAYHDEVTWGHVVLLRAISRISPSGHCHLPTYVLDHQLIVWMIDRMGFEGGGGRDNVTKATLVAWLLSPLDLADELEKYGRRLAERQPDDEAERTECKYSGLAKRVRDAAAGEQMPPPPHN